ncbi:hypothetical protein QYF61_027174 [Mycteria americana]|uniref:Uncharacterized protein n=1 Tax=Mycteria americana TaxID=33587 RepID=A0AAN7SEW2_MYCAM|nr:hypothetical protein QYF61_027174 [Mycteria americana]
MGPSLSWLLCSTVTKTINNTSKEGRVCPEGGSQRPKKYFATPLRLRNAKSGSQFCILANHNIYKRQLGKEEHREHKLIQHVTGAAASSAKRPGREENATVCACTRALLGGRFWLSRGTSPRSGGLRLHLHSPQQQEALGRCQENKAETVTGKIWYLPVITNIQLEGTKENSSLSLELKLYCVQLNSALHERHGQSGSSPEKKYYGLENVTCRKTEGLGVV